MTPAKEPRWDELKELIGKIIEWKMWNLNAQKRTFGGVFYVTSIETTKYNPIIGRIIDGDNLSSIFELLDDFSYSKGHKKYILLKYGDLPF